MEKIAELIIKGRWGIIVAVVAVTVFFGFQLTELKINADIMSSLPDDDPAALLYKDIGKEFGGNDMGMIALETDNIFKTEVLQHVKQITDTLRSIPGVSTVTSLTDILDIRGEEWGIEITRLIDEYDIPDTKEELDKLRERVFAKDMYRGAIVSEDATTTLIIYTTFDDADKQDIAKEIKENITSLNLPEKVYFAGLPMMMNDVSDLIRLDIIKLIPIVVLVIATILWFSFRSVRGIVLPLITSGIAIIWALGLMPLFGYELTIISNNIPIILFAVGSAYTIHVINRINYTFERDKRKAVITALSYIAVPVFLAAITTMIGFVSFIFGAYLLMIKDFGVFTAIGTFFAFILSVTFTPALVVVLSGKEKSPKTHDNEENLSTDFLSKHVLTPIQRVLFKHTNYILVAWIILILITIGGIFMIKRSVNMQKYFKKNNPTRVAEDVMQRKFGGSQPVYIVFYGDMQSPEVLQLMIDMEHYMKKNRFVTTAKSVADLISQMNDVMGEGVKVPKEKAKIEQLWFLLEGQDIMTQLVNDDLDKGIIQSRFGSYDSKDMADFVNYIDKFIAEHSNADHRIELTGLPSVYVRMDKSLFDSQMSSLAIALVLLLVIVGLILRSFSRGLYATIPIISTIAILFGFMGYTGISLDVATVLVASVALGIGIDYSIHIITHFNHAMNKHKDIKEAMKETIMMSGKAIIINVLSVAAGFLVLLFSQMVPLQNFGLLVALSMFGSGAGALTLLPAVLILANRKESKKQNTIHQPLKREKNEAHKIIVN